MAVGKKGFLFTAAAVLFVLVVVLLFSAQTRLLPRTISQTTNTYMMNEFLLNLEQDLPRVAYIAGFRSFIGIEEHISENGTYLQNFDAAFLSMFNNGTVNGVSYGIMENSTFESFSGRFSNLSRKQGIRSNLTVESVNAYHESPWEVTINFTVRVYLSDMGGYTSFNKTYNVSTRVPITDIKDPLYSVGTQGKAPHTIKINNVTRPFITATNVTLGLQTVVNQSMYTASSDAPSFLQRFTGNMSASPYGIQSLVNINELGVQGLVINECRSVVDYIYFDSTPAPIPNYLIVNMDNNEFWLDSDHLDDFDAVGKTTGTKTCT
jgi:hypothetical protein